MRSHRRPAILRTRLNGELKQHASIDMMMFTIAEILSFLTRTVSPLNPATSSPPVPRAAPDSPAHHHNS